MNYKRVKDLHRDPIDMTIALSSRRLIAGSSFDPEIFGPSLWFILHNGITNYPIYPTAFVKCGMRDLLINIPLLIPCLNCREHFFTFLRASNIDDAVSSREKLFKFMVDAHNFVNLKYGKQTMSLESAKSFYGFNDPGVGASVKIRYV